MIRSLLIQIPMVAPSGEVMLLDTGPARAAQSVLAFMGQNNIRKIDYLVASHFEDDHIGAAARIAEFESC
jgi:competence protein ComEC